MTDFLTPEERSKRMSLIKSADTKSELSVRSALHKLGLRFRKNLKTLPGKPDIVFTKQKVAVFIDGDFWHGYQFSLWQDRLNPSWRQKIEGNILRDQHNFMKLSNLGWKVIRIWEHEVNENLDQCVRRIVIALEGAKNQNLTKR